MINKVILIGHLGKDPELKNTASGIAVCNFTLATSEKFKDKTGEMQSRTTWHNIVAWDKQAEIIKEYVKKGSKLFIEGKISNRSYEDKEGIKRYVSEVVVNNFKFLDAKNDKPKVEDDKPEPEEESLPVKDKEKKLADDDDDLPF